MSEGSEIEVALTWAGIRAEDLRVAADRGRAAAEASRAKLDDIETRLAALGGDLQRTAVRASRSSGPSMPGSPDGWQELVDAARQGLQGRGSDLGGGEWEGLLDPEEAARIARRMHGGFQLRSRLDVHDVLGAALAATAAAIVDALVVAIPRDASWQGTAQKGSAFTAALRKLAVPHDNWLSEWARKVPYDQVANLAERVEGFAGTTHRVQTLGHDPLLGLVFGTLDIMRGTITAMPKQGGLVVLPTGVAGVPNPIEALCWQLVHLASDLPTRTGLPLPGWTALLTINAGTIGPRQETVAQVARSMYLRGYDTWHFLPMATSVAASELVLRGYWGLRAHFDEDWRDRTDAEGESAGGAELNQHPRFQSIRLLAHGMASAANLAKTATYGGNPVALNALQWVAFSRAFFSWYRTRLQTPTDLLLRRAERNADLLTAGWVGLDSADPTMPRLPVEEGTEGAPASG